MELYELGIAEAKEGLAKGDFSSVELTQAIIDRVRAKDGEIGAYLTFDEEGALAAAREACLARDEEQEGVPCAHQVRAFLPEAVRGARRLRAPPADGALRQAGVQVPARAREEAFPGHVARGS